MSDTTWREDVGQETTKGLGEKIGINRWRGSASRMVEGISGIYMANYVVAHRPCQLHDSELG